MKKILGLDLGSTSIGWAYIEEKNNAKSIKKLGVRIIPYSADEKDQFSKGQAISKNKDRTIKRTARKTNNRYKQRREALLKTLNGWGVELNKELMYSINALQLYGLRVKALTEKLSLEELSRILFHLNQKRGYKSSRHSSGEEESGKKLSDYLTELKDRKDYLEKNNITIGQFFYEKLRENPFFRIKQNVFPRECYIQEFNRIWDEQQKHYPTILTEENRKIIRDEIIFFQRRLKSQKRLVGECQFELHHKVAPKSSPLFQIEKIWESINTISLTNKYKEVYNLSIEQKQAIFHHLDNNEKLNYSELLKILGLKRTDGWYPNEQIKKAGLQGNTTKTKIAKELKALKIENPDLLQFTLKTEIKQSVNKETGEVKEFQMITPSFEKEPLYHLWHLLYSIDEPAQLINVLQRDYQFTKEQAEHLSKIDFKKAGFGSKSARAIRKLLPALMQGIDYSKAAETVGYNHSNSITKEENRQRELLTTLPLYKRNSLRQPVVEKIMNQLINVINNIINDEHLGKPDEIRIELARELKQSQEERNRTYSNTIETDKKHKAIRDRLEKEYPGFKISRKVIEKYKLYEQQDGLCMYSGVKMELAQVLRGEGIDVDHIIPQSRLFDDSFQNKVLAYRKENEKKGNETAYDFMKSKSENEFNQYIERVSRLFEAEKITKSKQAKLLMSGTEIPSDFINRQLNETRFISKEATKLLKQVCHNVHTTTGMVTDFLRNEWGYNEVLQQLNWEKYDKAGKTKDGKIKDWSKRDDHRHHAIDALVVACTSQSFIQRLNNLNSSQTREEMLDIIKGKINEGWQKRKSLIEQHVQVLRPFHPEQVIEAVDNILVSIKPGKRVAAKGLNKANGQRPLTPRGQLHKEFVYGKIKRYSKEKVQLNARFTKANDIANEKEKKLVLERLQEFNNDPKKAFKELDKNPIWLDAEKTKPLTAVTVWEEFYVIKYQLDQNFKEKDIDFIIDDGIREKVKQRFTERAGQKDHPLKNLDKDPIWLNEAKGIPVKTVRCFTGLADLVPLHSASNGITKPLSKKTEDDKPVDFVSTRNNHHIAIYQTPDGKLEDRTVTLWEAVERKKYSIPVIVTSPKQTWDYVLERGIEAQELLTNLPEQDSVFVTSLQQNEMFVVKMKNEEVQEAIATNNLKSISKNLYRVQKLTKKSSGSIDIYLRHHLETSVDDKKTGGEMIAKQIGKVLIVSSLKALMDLNPIKVNISHAGKITLIK
jgi:CRISPR-associated endonuclease Csn1